MHAGGLVAELAGGLPFLATLGDNITADEDWREVIWEVLYEDSFTFGVLIFLVALLLFLSLKGLCLTSTGSPSGLCGRALLKGRRVGGMVLLWYCRTLDVWQILLLSILWFVLSIPYALLIQRGRFDVIGDGGVFRAKDVYSDLTHPMFSVVTHFLLQSAFALMLVRYAFGVSDKEMPIRQSIFFEPIALTLQLYLVWRMPSGGWKEIAKLRGAVAYQVARKRAEEYIQGIDQTDRHVISKDGDVYVELVPWGDVWVRLAMSAMVNGLFQRFLILAYPIFVRAIPEEDGEFELVKDGLAITLVVQLDDLLRPQPFTVFRERTDKWEVTEPKNFVQRAMRALGSIRTHFTAFSAVQRQPTRSEPPAAFYDVKKIGPANSLDDVYSQVTGRSVRSQHRSPRSLVEPISYAVDRSPQSPRSPISGVASEWPPWPRTVAQEASWTMRKPVVGRDPHSRGQQRRPRVQTDGSSLGSSHSLAPPLAATGSHV